MGVVPREVGVVANEIKAKLIVTHTRSLKDILQDNDDPLPERYSKGKKYRTHSISGRCR